MSLVSSLDFFLVILKAVLNPCLLSLYVFLSLLIFFYSVRFGNKKKNKWFFEMRDDLIQIHFARLFFFLISLLFFVSECVVSLLHLSSQHLSHKTL